MSGWVGHLPPLREQQQQRNERINTNTRLDKTEDHTCLFLRDYVSFLFLQSSVHTIFTRRHAVPRLVSHQRRERGQPQLFPRLQRLGQARLRQVMVRVIEM